MDTAEISYRVAEFLKGHPPFNVMEDADLLELASRGRVRFHEAHDYVLWQGEPNRFKVFVIQQGTVSLWDERGDHAELRDVRGAGDMLGVEQFAGADVYTYSARTSTDVLIYAFASFDFEALVLKYPYARQYVDAYETVTADFRGVDERREPQTVFLHELASHRPLLTCPPGSSIRRVAQDMRATGADAIAVTGVGDQALGVVTTDALVAWIANGSGDVSQPVETLVHGPAPALAPAASVADGLLLMVESEAAALTMTADGALNSPLQAIITPRDLAPVFGDVPVAMLQEASTATTVRQLRAINHRVRAFALKHLTSGAGVEWIARFTHAADVRIVRRLLALIDAGLPSACWCMCGASGRQESMTLVAPRLVVVHDEPTDVHARRALLRMGEALLQCGYLPHQRLMFDDSFYAARTSEWTERYDGWMRDPVTNNLYQARTMLDLRPIEGPRELWQRIVDTVALATGKDVLKLLANDCLASLPPLTFFENAVVEESGSETTIFRLQRSALDPLVDVGRVFGAAAGKVVGTSTIDRLHHGRALLPDREAIFREAADTLRVVLWQQGRVGISQGTDGAELPPALLSRHDRHVLRSGFKSILRLIEFTASWDWLESL